MCEFAFGLSLRRMQTFDFIAQNELVVCRNVYAVEPKFGVACILAGKVYGVFLAGICRLRQIVPFGLCLSGFFYVILQNDRTFFPMIALQSFFSQVIENAVAVCPRRILVGILAKSDVCLNIERQINKIMGELAQCNKGGIVFGKGVGETFLFEAVEFQQQQGFAHPFLPIMITHPGAMQSFFFTRENI